MKVGLFIPCYVDTLYPEVGVAAYRLLSSLGVDVTYPEDQTCCGQPMGNAGYEGMSRKLVRSFDDTFSGFDYVVAPSASCAAYVRFFHPHIDARHKCEASGKTVDMVEFLHDILRVDHLEASFPHKVSVHNSCHGVRELGLSSPSECNVQPFNKIIDLLKLVRDIEIVEPERKDECCGFGGMFSIEETAVSEKMGLDKVRRHLETGAEYITGPDSSCLMHMQGVASKHGIDARFIHVVQILASGL